MTFGFSIVKICVSCSGRVGETVVGGMLFAATVIVLALSISGESNNYWSVDACWQALLPFSPLIMNCLIPSLSCIRDSESVVFALEPGNKRYMFKFVYIK